MTRSTASRSCPGCCWPCAASDRCPTHRRGRARAPALRLGGLAFESAGRPRPVAAGPGPPSASWPAEAIAAWVSPTYQSVTCSRSTSGCSSHQLASDSPAPTIAWATPSEAGGSRPGQRPGPGLEHPAHLVDDLGPQLGHELDQRPAGVDLVKQDVPAVAVLGDEGQKLGDRLAQPRPARELAARSARARRCTSSRPVTSM